jgi:hypothetical protein
MTNVLVKIFARGFFKVNSGFLVFLFAALLSYCFFINTAGDIKLLSASDVLYYNFIVLINFVSNPIITILFFIGWLAYTIKSWYYVFGQLYVSHHQFLFYSTLSSSRLHQFRSWFYAQFVISLPFVFYALIAVITGIAFHQYITVVIIILFTFLLISVSALIYVNRMNSLIREKSNSWLFNLSRYWRKPFFSLFIYYIFDRLKLTYMITKALSYLVIICVMFSLADVKHDPRVAGLAILGVVITHSILLYQQHKFELTYLSISRNFPYSISSLYLHYIFTYVLLLLPEVMWLFISFNPITAVELLLLLLSMTMLLHCILYKIGLAMNNYLPWVLGLFLMMFLFILFGWVWLLVPVCFVVSFTMFSLNYYKAEP